MVRKFMTCSAKHQMNVAKRFSLMPFVHLVGIGKFADRAFPQSTQSGRVRVERARSLALLSCDLLLIMYVYNTMVHQNESKNFWQHGNYFLLSDLSAFHFTGKHCLVVDRHFFLYYNKELSHHDCFLSFLPYVREKLRRKSSYTLHGVNSFFF